MNNSMKTVSQFLCYFLFLILNFSTPIVFSGAGEYSDHECTKERRCGGGHREPAVRFPFSLRNHHPLHCNNPNSGFELSCDQSHRTILNLPKSSKLFVKSIDYRSQEIEIYDPDRCLPKLLVSNPNLNFSESPFQFIPYSSSSDPIVFFNCSLTGDGETDEPDDFDHYIPCLSSNPGYGVRAVYYHGSSVLSLTGCRKIDFRTLVPEYVESSLYDSSLHLNWSEPDCGKCEAQGMGCGLKKSFNGTRTDAETECFDLPKEASDTKKKILVIVVGAIIVSLMLIIAIIGIYYIHLKNEAKRKNQLKIKQFLEDYKALKATRYSYIDIWRITREFSQKLGQGAFGTVYKGKLTSNILVAVKILDNLSGNGQEFINEVSAMGRVHHVNVARLIGFCADGSKRALVYEFFPNGSLEKYISPNDSLGWEKIQDVALGIAMGVEYLHHGCEMQILHFDIKPHNILLDHNFVPKISDFGMAKLCEKEESSVTVTAVRGTIGYMAPEVASRNFGKPSYKSDVYSFGMLLLEMVGGKKNIDVNIGNQGIEIGIGFENEGEWKIARKLTVVALKCIQWQPMDRPSMKVVVQMLEGEGESLIVPPNPYASIGRDTKRIGDNGTIRAQNFELEIISEAE